MSRPSDLGGLDSRHKSRVSGRLFRFMIWVAITAGFSYWAFVLGQERAGNLNRELQARLDQLATENERLRDDADAAVAARLAADDRAAAYQRQYLAEAPQGAAKQIMALVNERLESGVSPDRVAFVVAAAENETKCEREAASRRFLLQTPLTKGANSAVSFADNTITVTGAGKPSADAAGNPQAWFDPAQPVDITFTLIGGRDITINGKLPLHHSLVIDDVDHRFTVIAGKTRGFVLVTEQSCAYP